MATAAISNNNKTNTRKFHFDWEGKDSNGARVSGMIEAANQDMVKAQLRRQGITPLKVRKKTPSRFGGGNKKITPADIAIFARQLTTMMTAGVPLVQAFEIVANGLENKTMRSLILIIVLGLSACAAAPSQRIDWKAGTDQAVQAGKLRADRLNTDGPELTAAQLSADFDKIGFSFETRTIGVRNRTGDRFKVIRKWQHPVEYAVISPTETFDKVRKPFAAYMRKISEITGHQMRPAKGSGVDLLKWRSLENFDGRIVLLFGPDGFFHDIARGETPAPDAIRRFANRWRPSDSPCAGFVRHGSPSQPYTGPITSVVIAIRAELPDRLLTACIEEEFAQAMGLFDDDPTVRPSLFNDDQEFGVLTRHDELLLRILYDGRLKHGMPRARAMPIVRQIAAELLPDD